MEEKPNKIQNSNNRKNKMPTQDLKGSEWMMASSTLDPRYLSNYILDPLEESMAMNGTIKKKSTK